MLCHICHQLKPYVWVVAIIATSIAPLAAQQEVRRAKRTKAPEFEKDQFSGVFFDDLKSVLTGPAPSFQELANAKPASNKPNTTPSNNMADDSSSSPSPSNGEKGWQSYISAATIEDEIKQAKQRLDGIVTTPVKFAGGGFTEARVEFSQLALLFAIISEYPDQVRWKKSAPLARVQFSKMAGNAKVGSQQAYSEAKSRVADLAEMLNGNELAGDAPEETPGWEVTVDRQPLMKMLEVAHQGKLSPMVASEQEFKANTEEVLRFAELIAAYSAALDKPGMPDADDTDYKVHTTKMLEESLKVVQAVKTGNAEQARQATAQIGQACTKCHDLYR